MARRRDVGGAGDVNIPDGHSVAVPLVGRELFTGVETSQRQAACKTVGGHLGDCIAANEQGAARGTS